MKPKFFLIFPSALFVYYGTLRLEKQTNNYNLLPRKVSIVPKIRRKTLFFVYWVMTPTTF